MLANYKHNRMSVPIQLSKTINAPTYIYTYKPKNRKKNDIIYYNMVIWRK